MQSHQTSTSSPVLSAFLGGPAAAGCHRRVHFLLPIRSASPYIQNIISLRSESRNLRTCSRKWYLLSEHLLKGGILTRKHRRGHMQVARGFNFGGGGGRDWGDSNTKRVLGNLALAIGLTYLTLTGQLGWILDAVLSLWLLAVILPVLGLGAFIWFAGRDIIQDRCPNCGNDFQVLKSSLSEEGIQLCPFCAQPFSVQGNKFVRESARFSSNRSSKSDQVFSGFSGRNEKERASRTTIDIEAEVKDVD